jgi:hypothetical protein
MEIADALRRLSRVTAAMPTAQKNAKSHQHTYLDLSGLLAHVRPVLAAEGLSEVAEVTTDDHGRIGCRYVFVGPDDSYSTPWLWLPAASNAQDAGGEVSYLRRYVLSAACGVDASDDVDARPKPAAKKKAATEKPRGGIRDLQIAFSNVGIKGRDERLAYAEQQIGREINSSKDLTDAELTSVLTALRQPHL